MSLDGKLGILIVTMAFLFLIYLDNAGKLASAIALITGPVEGGAPILTSQQATPSNGLATLPVTAIIPGARPIPNLPDPGASTTGNGSLITIGGINGPVTLPSAPPLPGGH